MQKEGHNKLVLMGVLSILILLVVGFALGALEQTGAAVFTNPSKQVIGSVKDASSTVSRAAAQAAIRPTLPKIGHYASDVILSDGTSVEKKLADLEGKVQTMDREHKNLMIALAGFVSNDVKRKFLDLLSGPKIVGGWGHLYNEGKTTRLAYTIRTNFKVSKCEVLEKDGWSEFVPQAGGRTSTREYMNIQTGSGLWDQQGSENIENGVSVQLYDPNAFPGLANPSFPIDSDPGIQPNDAYYKLEFKCFTEGGLEVKPSPQNPVLVKWAYSFS